MSELDTTPNRLPVEPGLADALLRTGALTDDEARAVSEHQARSGLSFDESAVALSLATEEDVVLARQALQGSLALQLAPSAAVSEEVADAALEALCLEHIARFKRPKEYRWVQALPKNSYGKVLKTELRRGSHPPC